MDLGGKLNVPVPTTAISNEFLNAAQRGLGETGLRSDYLTT
ncbi:MAG: hypothetical protein WB919_19245 [Candidatus Sulfotelmatobacter sp.]